MAYQFQGLEQTKVSNWQTATWFDLNWGEARRPMILSLSRWMMYYKGLWVSM